MSFRKVVSTAAAASLTLALVAPAPGALAQTTSPIAGSTPVVVASVSASLLATSSQCSTEAIQAIVGPAVRLTSVQVVDAPAGLCRIQGAVTTTGEGAPDGLAHFEMNLPANWNGKLLFLGGGGFDGVVPQAPADRLASGYATLGTDSGHTQSPLYPPTGVDASWSVVSPGVKDEAKIADYAYRSRGQVNAQLRPVLAGFYGRGADYSYFVGCSRGGGEALIEAQRNPEAFDGFVAGNPIVSPGTALLAARNFRVLTQAPIPYDKFAEIDRAVMADCDERDGVKDGLIQNPGACAFDPRSLVAGGVLTAPQAQALTAYLSAPMDTEGRRVGFGSSVSGMGDLSAVFPGMTGGFTGLSVYLSDGLQPGAGEWPWGPMPAGPIDWLLFNGAIGFLSLAQPDVSVLSPTVTTEDGRIQAATARAVEAGLHAARVHPEAMGDFFRSGHKLIIYHGLEDTILDPYAAMDAYAQIVRTGGGLERTQENARLFMVPGMAHCAGGSGPNAFDPLTAMEAWVERGVAPDSIVAVKFENNNPAAPIKRSMPLCPFPAMARFDGEGRVEDAASWSCAADDARLLELGPNGRAAGLQDIVDALR